MNAETVARIGGYALAVLTVALSLAAAGHALLRKRESRAAALWVGLIALAPLVGAVIYFVFGINRIRRRASLLREGFDRYRAARKQEGCTESQVSAAMDSTHAHLTGLARSASRILNRPLMPGNSLEPLENGDEAFPAMLRAIAAARRTVSLSAYIFDRDEIGLAFVEALAGAKRRGVQVRVLIDAAGTRYSRPSILGPLRRSGVRFARFLPTFPLSGLLALNMRNHRKILIADGQTAFSGGMNIRAGHRINPASRRPIRDLHFRIHGPIVSHLQEAFVDDWFFTTGETLRGEGWFPRLEQRGAVLARGILDGPDENFDNLRWILLSALGVARHSVRIATPYFLPDSTLVAALNLAALRGVHVDILLPSRNNLPLVHWASEAAWWQVLEHGCRIYLSPPPFDHTKLFVVDEGWTLIGSTNWDPRSLRLNFECNVECYDPEFSGRMADRFDRRRGEARRITLAEVDARSFPVRLRDGVARLFSPFL